MINNLIAGDSLVYWKPQLPGKTAFKKKKSQKYETLKQMVGSKVMWFVVNGQKPAKALIRP